MNEKYKNWICILMSKQLAMINKQLNLSEWLLTSYSTFLDRGYYKTNFPPCVDFWLLFQSFSPE